MATCFEQRRVDCLLYMPAASLPGTGEAHLLKLNRLEPLASIGCGLAFIDGGITAAAVGATVLFTRFRENSAKHGLDDGSSLVAKVQQAILRKMDRWDATEAERDAVTLADAAMTQLLPQVMLSRDQLAASSVSLELYSRHAATLVVDALAVHDPIFAPGPEPETPAPSPAASHWTCCKRRSNRRWTTKTMRSC